MLACTRFGLGHSAFYLLFNCGGQCQDTCAEGFLSPSRLPFPVSAEPRGSCPRGSFIFSCLRSVSSIGTNNFADTSAFGSSNSADIGQEYSLSPPSYATGELWIRLSR
jgi:hypothetical protein